MLHKPAHPVGTGLCKLPVVLQQLLRGTEQPSLEQMPKSVSAEYGTPPQVSCVCAPLVKTESLHVCELGIRIVDQTTTVVLRCYVVCRLLVAISLLFCLQSFVPGVCMPDFVCYSTQGKSIAGVQAMNLLLHVVEEIALCKTGFVPEGVPPLVR